MALWSVTRSTEPSLSCGLNASFQSGTSVRMVLRRCSTAARRAPSSRSSAPSTVASASIGLTAVRVSPFVVEADQAHLGEAGHRLVQLVGRGAEQGGGVVHRDARRAQDGAVQRDVQLDKFAEFAHFAAQREGARQLAASSQI